MIKLAIMFLATVPATAQLWSSVLDDARGGVDWSSPGVLGGIPTNRTQCGSTIAAYTGASTTINSALSACSANQYVQLGAGTFNINSGGILISNKQNITLRGMGADQTFIVMTDRDSCQGTFASICVQTSDTNWKNGISNGPVTWSAGYTKGTTSITLSSVPNLTIGKYIILDQLDKPGTGESISSDDLVVCASTSNPICSLQGNGGGAQRSGRNQVQIVRVTGCNGSTTFGAACSGTNQTITISPGLYMPNWDTAQTPQAWWANNLVYGIGIEDLSIDHTGNTSGVGIEFFNAHSSWVKGVRSINSRLAHVEAQYGARITVRDSYFFLTQNSIDRSYAFHCYTGSDELIENNIFQAVSGPITINGACSGSVIGYNFDTLNYYTASSGFINAMSNVHTAGADSLLYEGNIGAQIYGDLFHGTHNMVTIFRNFLSGTFPRCWNSGSPYASATFNNCTSNRTPIPLLSYTRFFNVIGNVLGQSGMSNGYESTSPVIYDLGSGNSAGGVTVPSDAGVKATLYRWANYDTVSAAVRFCGGSGNTGWATTCSSTTEVPSAIAHYPQSIPATETLPNSFYYSGTPSWWPSGKAWPPMGADVSSGNLKYCSGGTNTNGYVTTSGQCPSGTATTIAGGRVNTNPAMDCFLGSMGGSPIGTDLSPLTFNAQTCYAASATSYSRQTTGKVVRTGKVVSQ